MDWKDEFLKLYISTNENEIQQAIDLKEEYIPWHLYRYRPAKKEEFVASELRGQIYMPHISELNDPFDSCALLSNENIDFYFVDRGFRQRIETIIGKKIPDDALRRDNLREDILKYALSHIGCSDRDIAEKLKKYHDENQKSIEDSNKYFNAIIKRDYRLCCFSESAYNLPMWSHYANNHSGICLQYDTLRFRYNDSLRKRLFPVFYTEKLPDALKIIKKFHFENLPKTLFEYTLISKLKDWEYEKEWRLILDCRRIISENEKVSDDYWNTGKTEWLARPSKVYLGVKMNKEMKSFIVDICRELGISVYQMECTEYGLKEVLTK